MATLSLTLLSALDQSMTPPVIRHSSSAQPLDNSKDENKTLPVPPAKEPMSSKDHTGQPGPGLTHFSDGLDEDIYWNDGSA